MVSYLHRRPLHWALLLVALLRCACRPIAPRGQEVDETTDVLRTGRVKIAKDKLRLAAQIAGARESLMEEKVATSTHGIPQTLLLGSIVLTGWALCKLKKEALGVCPLIFHLPVFFICKKNCFGCWTARPRYFAYRAGEACLGPKTRVSQGADASGAAMLDLAIIVLSASTVWWTNLVVVTVSQT